MVSLGFSQIKVNPLIDLVNVIDSVDVMVVKAIHLKFRVALL
jgi:hypothetical protein